MPASTTDLTHTLYKKISSLGVFKNRSWIFQERFLSPRVLHFSDKQLSWKCAELQASESYPSRGAEYYGNAKATTPFEYPEFYSTSNNCDAEPLWEKSRRLCIAFRIWEPVVSTYTKRKLTKDSDKLIAISAVAREVQHIMQSRYLAGLWEVDLVSQLAWWCDGVSGVPLTVYRAPSWSWASRDGQISSAYYPTSDSYYPLIEILEAVASLVSEDQFGQVHSGHLKLLGQTFDLKSVKAARYNRPPKIFFNDRFTTKFLYRKDDHKMKKHIRPKQYHCLPLDIKLEERILFNGLIFESLDVNKNLYRRVGLLYCPTYLKLTQENFPTDPVLSMLGKIEQIKDGSLIFKRDSSNYNSIE
ncbi:hypothetical protein BPAE_0064g00060 [Botrytis paeoniae]|uniref:Heterokaryon incompatibility domain-containing protein n=1 Tax=Botrytis paeoniae TaxID=278948 RepID=A0A4Z1FS90_9HELO|nr:hypothetical protein BPAE_0064g00060 [Botrytis paeoniae]